MYLSERLNFYHSELENISKNYFFNKPLDVLAEYSLRIDEYRDMVSKVVKNKFDNLNNELSSIEKLIFNTGPEQTLKRGFSYVLKDGKIISRKKQLHKDDDIMIRFQDGDKGAIIN